MPIVKYGAVKLENVRIEGASNTVKADVIGPAQGWRDNTLRVFRIGAGGCTPRHQHDWEHVTYVIRGQARLSINGVTHELAERDFAFVPPNALHQFENPYDEEFEFICIVPNRGA